MLRNLESWAGILLYFPGGFYGYSRGVPLTRSQHSARQIADREYVNSDNRILDFLSIRGGKERFFYVEKIQLGLCSLQNKICVKYHTEKYGCRWWALLLLREIKFSLINLVLPTLLHVIPHFNHPERPKSYIKRKFLIGAMIKD